MIITVARDSARMTEVRREGRPSKGKEKAAEYIRCAPTFVKTDLRDKLQAEPWFPRTQLGAWGLLPVRVRRGCPGRC